MLYRSSQIFRNRSGGTEVTAAIKIKVFYKVSHTVLKSLRDLLKRGALAAVLTVSAVHLVFAQPLPGGGRSGAFAKRSWCVQADGFYRSISKSGWPSGADD